MGRRPRGLALFKPSHLEQRSGPSPITEMVLKGTASKLTASPVEMPAAPIRGPESARQNNAFLREPDTPTGQVPQSHSLSDRQASCQAGSTGGQSLCIRKMFTKLTWVPIMILPQVHLRKPCYDFYFL